MKLRISRSTRSVGAATAVLLAIALVPVSSAAATTAATLNGTVTDLSSAAAVPNMPVALLQATSTGPLVLNQVATTTTLADGSYEFDLTALTAGDYTLYFGNPFHTPYRSEYWNDQPRDGVPTLLTVDPTSSLPGMDAALEHAPELWSGRLAGADRFATSVSIAQWGWSPSDTPSGIVFVANGLDYPDALSVAPLAGWFQGPLLLTRPTSLPTNVRDEIVALNPDTIVVIGGPGVVSAAVYSELAGLAPNIDRVYGQNRYATSREAARHAGVQNLVYLATGRSYPDALSAAAAAGSQGAAVLLVDGAQSTLDAATVAFLRENNPTVHIVGGTGVVSVGIENQLRNTLGLTGSRFAGANRYLTSVAVNQSYFTTSNTGPSELAFLATGAGFADALAGSAAAGALDAPLFLSQPSCLPPGIGEAVLSTGATGVMLLGGTGVLSANVENLRAC